MDKEEKECSAQMTEFIRLLQICVCISIIKETPKHLMPKQFAQSLQNVLKTEEPICSSESPNILGKEKAFELETSKAGSLKKIQKIVLKPPEKLVSKNILCTVEPNKCSSKVSATEKLFKGENIPHLSDKTTRQKIYRIQAITKERYKDFEVQSGSGDVTFSSRKPDRSLERMKRIHLCPPRIQVAKPVQNQCFRSQMHSKVPDDLNILGKEKLLRKELLNHGVQESLFIQNSVNQGFSGGSSNFSDCHLSLLEQFSYKNYFELCHNKAVALEFILKDFFQVAQMTIFSNRELNEEAVQEMLQIIKFSLTNNVEHTTDLCIQFVANLLKTFTTLPQHNMIEFEKMKKIYDVIKEIVLAHHRHLEPCGERTVQFLCYLLVLHARGCFIEDIGFCMTNLLTEIISHMKKITENRVNPHCKEESTHLIDIALKALAQSENFQEFGKEDFICNDISFKGLLLRWKWMLQDGRQTIAHSPSIFLMQVHSLIQLIDSIK